MQPISWMSRTTVVLACLAVVVATAACGSDDTASSPTSSTVTVTQSASPISASADGADAPVGDTSTPAADPPADLGSQPAPRGKRSDGSSRQLTAADVTVGRENFAGDGGGGRGYYFQSPSGNIQCGIGFENVNLASGCQAKTSVRSSTGLTCKNGGNSVYAGVFVSGAVLSRCVNQPFYVGNTVAGQPAGAYGGRVLQYGQTVEARGTTCTSRIEGITCYNFGFGFTMSRDRNEFF